MNHRINNMKVRIKNSKVETSNTRFKGIHFRSDRGIFEAQLSIPRKKICATNVFIGNFASLKEAKKAREEFILGLL